MTTIIELLNNEIRWKWNELSDSIHMVGVRKETFELNRCHLIPLYFYYCNTKY